MDAFLGSWKLDLSKNVGMDVFGKAMGLSQEQIDNYSKLTYVVNMAKDVDNFTVAVDFGGLMPNRSYTIKLGETVDYSSPAGVNAKLTVVMSGDTLVETYNNEEKNTKWVVQRTVCGNEMTAVTTLGDATMTQGLFKV